MKPSLYLETSVVSYLTARPSGDLVTAARQKITSDWWETRRSGYDIFISPFVLQEAERGDAKAAELRISALREFDLVSPTAEAEELAGLLMGDLALPPGAANDAAHISVAVAGGADFLLTWNFRHIANPILRKRIEATCRKAGYQPPVICTPEELLEGTEP